MEFMQVKTAQFTPSLNKSRLATIRETSFIAPVRQGSSQ